MLAIDNFKKVYSVLRHFFVEKYGLDIEQLKNFDEVMDVKRMIHATMKGVHQQMPALPVAEKNKIVLREAKEALLQLYVKLREEADAQRAHEQQRINASRRVLPDAPSQYKQHDVNKEFAAISEAREHERLAAMPAPPGKGFTIDQDPAFSTDEFAARLQTLERQRDGDAMLAPASPYKMDDGMNMIKPYETGPSTSMSPPQFQAPVVQPPRPATHETSRTVRVLIDSVDRDVVAYPRKSEFRVRFGRPVWQNLAVRVLRDKFNEHIAGTKTAHFDGIPNSFGFRFNGTDVAAFDATALFPQPLLPSDVVGEATVSVPADNNASLATTLDDVHSIEVAEVVLPFRATFNKAPPPTILLGVDEFDGAVDCTADAGCNALCILSAERVMPPDRNNVQHIVYRPAGRPQAKTFQPALQNMRFLTFHIWDSSGAHIEDARDGATIRAVDSPATGELTLDIDDDAATQYDIQVGHRVRLVELVAYALSAQDDALVGATNAVLNQAKGHDVVAASGTTVTLRVPGIDAAMSAFLRRLATSNAARSGLKYVHGYVINVSKQASIAMVVSMQSAKRLGA